MYDVLHIITDRYYDGYHGRLISFHVRKVGPHPLDVEEDDSSVLN